MGLILFPNRDHLGPDDGRFDLRLCRKPGAGVWVRDHRVLDRAVFCCRQFALNIAPRANLEEPVGVILDGLRYIWRNKLILGCMSLDLFAVLLGGAVALLPVYAREILAHGP